MISRIASQNANNTSSASASATYPAATTTGNLLVALYWSNVTGDTLAISGWTKDVNSSDGSVSNSFSVFHKLADGTETTVTGTGGSTNHRMFLMEYTGAANPIALDGTAAASSAGTGTTSTTASLTTTRQSVVIGGFSTSGAVTSPAASSLFALASTGLSPIRAFVTEAFIGSPGSFTSTATWTSTATSRNLIVAYRAAVEAGIRIVNATTTNGSTTSTTPPAQVIPTSTRGNILVAVIQIRSAGATSITSVTDDAGNTWSAIAGTGTAFGSSQGWHEWWICTNPAPATNISVNPAISAGVTSTIYEIAGAAANPIDQVVQATGNSTAPASGSTSTTTQNNELVIGASGGHVSSTQTYASGYAMSPLASGSSPSVYQLLTGYKKISTSATQSWSNTLGVAGLWAATVVTFKGGNSLLLPTINRSSTLIRR